MKRRIPPPPGYVERPGDHAGGDADIDDVTDPSDAAADGADDGDLRPSDRSSNKAHRDAAKYRAQRNRERNEHADTRARAEAAESALSDLRLEIAFERKAGATFIDNEAAWKLIDKSILSIDAEGAVVGIDQAIADLCDRRPFLMASGDDVEESGTAASDGRNPFKSGQSGRPAGRARPKPRSSNRASLERKYPALRDR